MIRMRFLRICLLTLVVMSFGLGSIAVMAEEVSMDITMTPDYETETISVTYDYVSESSHYFEVAFTDVETTTMTTYNSSLMFLMVPEVTNYSVEVFVYDEDDKLQGSAVTSITVKPIEEDESVIVDEVLHEADMPGGAYPDASLLDGDMSDIDDEELPQSGGVPMNVLVSFGSIMTVAGYSIRKKK